MADINSPLNDGHLATINNSLDAIRLAEQQIDQASRAGIDLADLKQQTADSKSKLLQIKQVYFPGR